MSTLRDLLTLCFHGIGRPGRPLEPGEEVCWLEPTQFAAILDEVVDVPGVHVTFDDGNKSDVSIALPLLQERGLTASFFVIANRIDTEGSLSTEDLRQLVAAGMTVGSHGHDHRPWRRLDGDTRRRELVDARGLIEAASGRSVSEAACPFGVYDRRTLRSLRALGYERVYTVDGGYGTSGAWLQTRRSVHADDSAHTVRALVHSARRGPLAHPTRTAKMFVKRWR